MPGRRTPTPQQQAARELALTPPANPYRGALLDPYAAVAPSPTAAEVEPVEQPTAIADRPQTRMPSSANFAAIIGIVLGLLLALSGLVLLTVLSLEHDYGAPDRSFYRGSDSGYLVLGLLDFGLAICCAVGGILLLGGRVLGRVALTAGGWATLVLAGYWLVAGGRIIPPLLFGLGAALMLALAYNRAVTEWLGVLAPPQPE